jgi:hypothetical protein
MLPAATVVRRNLGSGLCPMPLRSLQTHCEVHPFNFSREGKWMAQFCFLGRNSPGFVGWQDVLRGFDLFQPESARHKKE